MTETALAATASALTPAAPASPPAGPVPAPSLRAVPPPPVTEPAATTESFELPRARLEIPGYDITAALALERELGVSHVLAQVLVRRGLGDARAAAEFLAAQHSHDPSEFNGIEAAIGVVRRHIAAGTRITVHGDYDVDGVCATAVMVRALRSLGANADWFLPSRTEDGYGLSVTTVQRLAGRGTQLLVTVDCGITAVEPVEIARAAGLETIVTDHHAPRADGQLPACPIVHPRICGYPCPDLCGTAVAFKLAQALGAGTAPADIELVALATVADLMPLQGENRRLVREGLRAIANTVRPGLRALLTVARADPSAVDAHTLGFRLAPRINAAGRLRRPDAGLELLLTEDPQRAAEIAAELDALNVERRAVEQQIVWEAERQAAARPDRTAFVLDGEDWHPGVIGIVASRIVERYHRPAIVIAVGEDGSGQGSGRSIAGFDLLAGLHATADHLEAYGGHRAAAGLTIRLERLEAFREAFERYAGQVLTPELLQPLERVDAVVSGADLGLELAEELAALEPCGLGNPGSRLLVPGARFDAIRPMGEGRHARFSVLSGGVRASAVAFGCDGQLAAEPGRPCDATFRLERNVWNGAVQPRLVLRHRQPCTPAPIRVLGEAEDYLRAVIAELDAPPPPPAEIQAQGPARSVLDRRGESPLAVLADTCSTGDRVLAICADVPRRLEGLAERTGGFALACHHALEREPALAAQFEHVVVLDPAGRPLTAAPIRAPAASAGVATAATGGAWGYTHLAFGEAELRFAQQMHELEYGLRASLTTFYRALRERGTVAGEELERLLRGDGPHGRPARLAGRLIRVFAELELVSLDRDLPALTVTNAQRTELECSAAYRAYTQRYEDGRRFLSSGNLPRGA